MYIYIYIVLTTYTRSTADNFYSRPMVMCDKNNPGSGHILNLLLTELRPGYNARIVSPYINTTNKCVELFYWLQVYYTVTSEPPILSVIIVDEERDEQVMLTRRKGPDDWSRLFVALPSGLHQLVIDGRRGLFGMSGISLDDITLQDCNQFSKKPDI